MDLLVADNVMLLYSDKQERGSRHDPQTMLDAAVREGFQALWDSGNYVNDRNDDRILADLRRYLMHSPTIANIEVERAIRRWVELNDALVSYSPPRPRLRPSQHDSDHLFASPIG